MGRLFICSSFLVLEELAVGSRIGGDGGLGDHNFIDLDGGSEPSGPLDVPSEEELVAPPAVSKSGGSRVFRKYDLRDLGKSGSPTTLVPEPESTK